MSKLMKKISSLILLIAFTSVQFSPLFAEEIELTDNELDQIHAGGLNFNFDSFYGNVGSTTSSQGPTDLSTSNGTNPVGANSGGNQKVTILSPLQVKSTIAPTAPKVTSTVVSTSVPSTPKSPLQVADPDPVALASTPEVPNAPLTPEPVSSPQGLTVPATPDVPGLPSDPSSPATPAIPDTTLVPEIPSSPATPADPATAATPVDATAPAAAALPVNPATPSIPATPETPAAPASPSATAVPEVPATPSTPTTPTAAMVFDVIAGNKANGSFEISVNGNNDLSQFVVPTSSTQNSLNVADSSQAGLQALVNVNAAGSVVPVLLNLTVIMGDNYGNITNSNDLNLSQFTTFQIP